MKRLSSLTQERLRELLHYNPETGRFTWRITVGSRAIAGKQAGGVGGDGYRRIRVDGVLYKEHRLAVLYMTGSFPADEVDHGNRRVADNRWKNLREANSLQNKGNCRLRSDNTSGSRSVYWSTTRGKWQAQISINGRQKFLGRFSAMEEAKDAYAKAAAQHFGVDFSPVSGDAQ